MDDPETHAYGIGHRTKKENTQKNNIKWTRRTTQKTGMNQCACGIIVHCLYNDRLEYTSFFKVFENIISKW